jgi:hypothetical protein
MDVEYASTDDGARVIQYTPHGGANQQWLLHPVGSTAAPVSTASERWTDERSASRRFIIAQLMGHGKVDTTLNVYAQVVDGSLRRAANTVGSELFTIVHKPEEDDGASLDGQGLA